MPAQDLPETALGPEGGFLAACRPEHLVLFSLNVGDGDGHVLLTPEIAGRRRAVIVDAVDADKLHDLLLHLSATPLLDTSQEHPFALVVATHPHDDHIRGMATFLRTHVQSIGEFWEPGYYHTTDAYFEMMAAVEDLPLRHLEPTSGTVRWIDTVKCVVLAPGVALKNRYDSYGIEINDSSIVLKLEFPVARLIRRGTDRTYVRPPTQTVILGADAQTTSWSQVLTDFPQLGPSRTAANRALRMQNGVEPLRAGVFKVPHHGSKRGLNFELVENVDPSITLFSCGRDKGKYFFPHIVTQELVREALQPIATEAGTDRESDARLGIHYTGSLTDTGAAAGSIGVLIAPSGRRQIWRFMDARHEMVDMGRGRLVR